MPKFYLGAEDVGDFGVEFLMPDAKQLVLSNIDASLPSHIQSPVIKGMEDVDIGFENQTETKDEINVSIVKSKSPAHCRSDDNMAFRNGAIV